MALRHVVHPFEPIIDERSRVLILGSVPSVASVERDFYYMHPQNRFWKLMSALLGEDLCHADKAEKISVLRQNRIALYDSVEECEILSSSDSKIKVIRPADIPSLLSKAEISRIFCNGNASYGYLVRFYPDLANMARKLPSTSPANAAFSLARLIDEWSVIKAFI